MPRTKISEFSATAADNTDIDSIDIAEGCAPSGINNAIRELMAQLKDMQTGASGDTFTLTNVNSTTVDTTNLEVTNIKAKDGTAAASIADSTGVFTHATNTVFPAGAVGTPSITTAGDTNTGIFFPAADTIAFTEGGVESMRIDSSGNVGIGVTPSAWDAGYEVLQNRGGALWSGSSAAVRLTQNAYFATSYKYVNSVAASMYAQVSGAHQWHTAPSGTAGNAISFTQAMTLDASGNLGIGTTNAAPANGKGMSINGGSITRIDLRTSTSGDASGDGTSLQLNGNDFTIENRETGFVAIATSLQERMRIDSSGNLLVGQTSWSFSNNGTQIAANGRIYNTSNTDYNLELAGSTSARIRFYTSAGGNGTTVGSITVSGSATTYATSSDYRLKENVAPMTGALATVAQLKPVTYTWKSSGEAGQGFIAHELQAVVPDCVTGEKDAVDENGNPKYQGVDTSFLVATLVSAIQELTARLEVLENK